MKKFSAILLTATMVCTTSVGVFANTPDKTCKSYSTCKAYSNMEVQKKLCSTGLAETIEKDCKVKVLNSCDKSDSKKLCINSDFIQCFRDQNCKQNGNTCATKPNATKPSATKPNATKPNATKPSATKPSATKPSATKPSVTKPSATKPNANNGNTAPVNKPNSDNNTNKPSDKPSNGNTEQSTNNASYAEQVVRLVNEERAKAGLSPVTLDTKVAAAAQLRATEIKTSFSHTRPNGSSCFTALAEKGASYRGCGENIAYGQKTPEEVMKGWMNSEGHRANILKKEFTNIGVGYYQDANGTNYWTQFFTY